MNRARKNLALATIAFTICFTSWGLVAPLAKNLQDSHGWSDTQVLLLAAVPVLCGSLLRIPAGWLADRFGGRRIFTVTMLLSILPALLLGYVTDYGALLVIGFFMGAAGSAFAVGVPFVVGWYERSRQGFAVGVYALGTIGPAIALLVVPRTLERYGQAYLGWGMAAILVGGAGMMWFLSSDAPNPPKPTRYADVLGAGWRLWRLALLYFLTFGAFVAMFTFLQKLLTKWFAISDVDAGARAAGFAAVAVAARPVGGWLADRYGGATVLTAAFAGIAVDGAVLGSGGVSPDDADRVDRMSHDGGLPGNRERCGVQAGAAGVSRESWCRDRDRRRGRGYRRVLPTGGDGVDQGLDRELCSRIRRVAGVLCDLLRGGARPADSRAHCERRRPRDRTSRNVNFGPAQVRVGS